MLGLFGFARIAGGGHIRDTANDNKDSSNNTGEAEEPLDEIGDHLTDLISCGATTTRGEIASKIAVISGENDTDGAHDDAGEHGDSEANEGMREGFLTGGNFAGITAREHIKVATVDGVTEHEVSGGDANVCGDVRSDLPDAGADS